MLVAAGYAGEERHAAEHVSYTDHIYQLRRSFDLDSAAVDTETLSRYLQNWLKHHILIQDLGYRPLFDRNLIVETVGLQFGHCLADRPMMGIEWLLLVALSMLWGGSFVFNELAI
tara:strand:- start:45 stop:389 length:345 start_codon:yes stop_codon:yes gene_type:complete